MKPYDLLQRELLICCSVEFQLFFFFLSPKKKKKVPKTEIKPPNSEISHNGGKEYVCEGIGGSWRQDLLEQLPSLQ